MVALAEGREMTFGTISKGLKIRGLKKWEFHCTLNSALKFKNTDCTEHVAQYSNLFSKLKH